MSTPIRTLCLLFVALMPISVMNAKPSGKGPTVRIVANELPNGLSEAFIQSDEKKPKPLELTTNRLSEPIALASSTMVLKAADGKTNLCTVTLPDTGKSFTVLLVLEKAGTYTPFVVRTDDPAFKAGDIFFVNHTAKSIAMKLGGTELVIEPEKTAKAHPTKPVENSYVIVISERNETGDKVISSTRWPTDANLRSYIFLTTNASGRTIYRAVDEPVEKR